MITIYKITSPSGRIYIGQASNFKRRKTEYKRNKCKAQTLLYNSLNKYGYETHTIEVVEKVDKEVADERETYWIAHYNTYNTPNGLNLTPGGRRPAPKKGIFHYKAKPIYQHTLSGDLVKRWECITDAANFLGINRNCIGAAVKSKGRYKNYLWSFDEICHAYIKPSKGGRKGKTIYQYDINGNFIKEYVSILQASKELGICRRTIKRFLNDLPIKRFRSSYRWSYIPPAHSSGETS